MSLRRIRKERNKRFEREIERERKRDPTPIASTRAFERFDLVVGAAVSRREGEREREIGLLLPSSFLKLRFFPLGVVAAVTEALLCQPKKGEKEANLDPERAVGVGVEASGEKGPRTRD